jgi:prevent-host-death family protein
MYALPMEVAITEFRAALRAYVDLAKQGGDVVLTERGVPVARLVAVDAAPLLEQLERDGVVSPPSAARPQASGAPRAEATGPVADLVSELRH